MDITVGHLGLGLYDDGICYYGKGGLRVVFQYPIHVGTFVIKDVGNDPIRIEVVKERKQHFIIGYDSRLGMVVKAELHRAHVMPVIIESICRKFKVSSITSKMQTITKNGVKTTRRIWIENPDVVDEEQLRNFLCKGRKRP
jgi:hypothetical protein